MKSNHMRLRIMIQKSRVLTRLSRSQHHMLISKIIKLEWLP